MSHENIIRAWKDEAFRNSLSDKAQALLPENPAGLVQLTDTELGAAGGGINEGPWCEINGRVVSFCGCQQK
jgi:mersacidin/lichenicidin family type 2 lantibiotic